MARKTKAEMAAEREEAVAAREAHDFAVYPSLLMAQLERATSHPNWFELTVRNSRFVLTKGRDVWEFPVVHTMQAQNDLDSLMWDLDIQDEKHRKHAACEAAKQAALAKLSKEERELLGV